MTEVKKSRSELKREAIIDGAMQAFQEFGVKDTSMDKIAELANVSKRTVYNHFESKEFLVTQIITEIWTKNIAEKDFPYSKDKPLHPQLINIVDNELELMSCPEMMELIRVTMGHFLFHPEILKEQTEKFFSQETGLKRWLKAAVDDGRLRKMDIEFANEQLISLIKGRAFWPQFMKQEPALNQEQREELAEHTAGMFLSYYEV